MQAFDASSILHAWDIYPIENFPPLWDWIAEQIDDGEFIIPRVALEEVSKKSPECGAWLKAKKIKVLRETNRVLQEAKEIKKLLGISNDKYGNGVGENDLLIVASAKVKGCRLVSEEKRQPDLPKEMKNCKIPAVCNLPGVQVPCDQFIDLIRNSGAVFK